MPTVESCPVCHLPMFENASEWMLAQEPPIVCKCGQPQAQIRPLRDTVARSGGVPGVMTHIATPPGIVEAKRSDLELLLAGQLRRAGVPAWEEEYPVCSDRGWRLDFAWPAAHVAVEIQGNAHRTRQRFAGDSEKVRAAQLMGWLCLPYTGAEVRSGLAAREIAEVVQSRTGNPSPA